MTSLTPARRPAALLAAASAGLLLSGCSFWAPNTAVQPWTPGEGLQSEIGDVLVRNVLVVSEGGGAPGVVVGALVSRGQEDATVTVEVGGSSTEVDLAPDESVVLGQERDVVDEDSSVEEADIIELRSELVPVAEVEPRPGDVVDVVVTVAAVGSEVLRVPVVAPEGIYADLDPADLDPADLDPVG